MGDNPSITAFEEPAENIAIMPITTRKIVTITRVLSGGEII